MILLLACAREAPPPPPAVGCPPGMVAVGGRGRVGLEGTPYGVVETRQMAVVEAPERLCPVALESAKDPISCWVQTDVVDPILRPREVELAPFCVEALPFPGAGADYTADGMMPSDVAALDRLLRSGRYGRRRLCTATELQAAIAGLSSNRRVIYGEAHDPARCASPIGSDPACANPETGLREYAAVHGHWAVADADFVAHACDAPPCLGAGDHPLKVGSYVVLGGTGRFQTRQAPLTPHTWHDHGEPSAQGCLDPGGWDDQPAICADPGAPDPAGDAAWAELAEVARRSGSMAAALEAGLGGPICSEPASPAEERQ